MRTKLCCVLLALPLLAAVSVQAQVMAVSADRAECAETPTAEILLNKAALVRGVDEFRATFRLNADIPQAFNVYSVVLLPGGQVMLDVRTLTTDLVALASNVPNLKLPFPDYSLLVLTPIPVGAPVGDYVIMVGFFTPGALVSGPNDAFLLVQTPFTIS